jgi:predicted Zn-dependent protease
LLREAIRVKPDDSQRTLALLSFHIAFRGGDKAEQAFIDTLAAHPKDTTLRFARVDYLRGLNRGDEARRQLDDIVALGRDEPAGLAARGQIAALHLAAGETAKAHAMLDEVIKVNPRDASGLLLRGRILLADGKPRDAVTDLRAAVKDRPGEPEVVATLAAAHRALDEAQLAREVIVDAVKFAPDNAVLRLMLANDLAVSKDPKAALLEVAEALRLAPRNPSSHQAKADLLATIGDFAGAERAAQTLVEMYPKSPLGPMTLARILVRQKKFDAALRQYDVAQRLAPTTNEPVLAAVALLVGQKRWAEAATRIDAVEAARPQSPMARQMRAEMAMAKGDLAQAEQNFQALVARPDALPTSYKNLAAVQMARKNSPAAMATLDVGIQAHPRDTMLPAAQAEWLLKLGRIDEAISRYEALLARAPTDDTAANNLAYTLAESKGDAASLQRALSLSSRFATSNQAGQLDTLGFIRYRMGQYDQATLALERAVALAPDEPVLQLHLGMALARQGETQRGRALMQKAIDSKVLMPHVGEARALLARS